MDWESVLNPLLEFNVGKFFEEDLFSDLKEERFMLPTRRAPILMPCNLVLTALL
jgi:hypothetical protein